MIRVPVTEIHEIELSSMCNLACTYCPHPKLERPKEHMPWPVLLRALEHVRHYVAAGTQYELSLTGIGEAILYPRLEEAFALCREVMGDRNIVCSTNGVAVTDEIAVLFRDYRVFPYVSVHRPEVAGPAVQRFKRAGVAGDFNDKFITAAYDWAGQVDVPWAIKRGSECHYLKNGWAVVRQDGSVDACCWDAHDKDPIGHVRDPVGSLTTREISLCRQCAFTVPASMREEAAA